MEDNAINNLYPEDPDEGKKTILPKMDYSALSPDSQPASEHSTNPNNISE